MFYLTGSCDALKLPNFNRLVDTWIVTHQARVGFRNLAWIKIKRLLQNTSSGDFLRTTNASGMGLNPSHAELFCESRIFFLAGVKRNQKNSVQPFFHFFIQYCEKLFALQGNDSRKFFTSP